MREEKNIIIFEKRKILIRAITDYMDGITDGYALEEFRKFGSPLQFCFLK
jgi:dGTPase